MPFVGNPLVLLLGASLFLLSPLALGLLISTLCATQQQAFATNFFVLNPFFILSGFGFPIASMPEVLQWFTYVNPLRYFLVVIRGTFLKGVGVDVLWPDLAAMAAHRGRAAYGRASCASANRWSECPETRAQAELSTASKPATSSHDPCPVLLDFGVHSIRRKIKVVAPGNGA